MLKVFQIEIDDRFFGFIHYLSQVSHTFKMNTRYILYFAIEKRECSEAILTFSDPQILLVDAREIPGSLFFLIKICSQERSPREMFILEDQNDKSIFKTFEHHQDFLKEKLYLELPT